MSKCLAMSSTFGCLISEGEWNASKQVRYHAAVSRKVHAVFGWQLQPRRAPSTSPQTVSNDLRSPPAWALPVLLENDFQNSHLTCCQFWISHGTQAKMNRLPCLTLPGFYLLIRVQFPQCVHRLYKMENGTKRKGLTEHFGRVTHFWLQHGC